MTDTEQKPADAKVKARIGDPMRGVGQVPTVILPDPVSLFARRAARLDTLADGHPMAAWLRFVAALARAQQAAVFALPPSPPTPLAQPGVPRLAAEAAPRDGAWHGVLRDLAQSVRDAPAETRAVCDSLLAGDTAARATLADAYLRHAVPPAQTGHALFIAAALQVWFAHCAGALPRDAIGLLAQRGRCPACGFAPVAGIITAAGAAPGTRYLHCGLCATAWNHVRAVCTGCGGSGGLALQQIAGGGEAVKAETCTLCNGYAKLFYAAHDMQVEPLADDMASLGLDMLVSEAGFVRLAPSPLLIGA